VWWSRLDAGEREAWRDRARDSILEVNDGIVSAAGVAEGFASSGATTRTLLFAGLVVILAGGLAAAGARYAERRTEWEMNRTRIEEERASIQADPQGEFEELVGLYELKGLSRDLARQVAAELTEHDPVAAHTDAELRLDGVGERSDALPAAFTAGLSYGIGGAVPLVTVYLLPLGERVPLTFVTVLAALALTGWFAAWLTDLPMFRVVRRNVVLGTATMGVGLLVGQAVHL
jgi:VIT1/CCC1 family predicted Fe2+/Mn2+ transporter